MLPAAVGSAAAPAGPVPVALSGPNSDRAAVGRTVQLAKGRGHRGIAGLANGVLRAYLRDERRWPWQRDPQTVEEWALATSHPGWMVRRLQEVFGAETAKEILEANNEPPTLSLRVNPLRADREGLLRELAESAPGRRALRSSPPRASIAGGIPRRL